MSADYPRPVAERDVPLFSIGAVARMVGLSAATIRTWEARYGLLAPTRSPGGQRLYSRDQVEQLRYLTSEVEAGRRPAEAHRMLGARVERGERFTGTRTRVLVAERRLGAARALREILGVDTFEVLLASDPSEAHEAFDELEPAVVVVDTDDGAFGDLAERLRLAGVKVLPIGLLERPLALLEEIRPALR